MFVRYFVWVVFIGVMVFGLFLMPSATYGQIPVPVNPIEIPLLPIKWFVKSAGANAGAGVGVVHEGVGGITKALTETLFRPIGSAISLILLLWALFIGIRIVRAALDIRH